jgi:DNA primase
MISSVLCSERAAQVNIAILNLHRVTGAKHLVLVEGYWSVFRLHTLDIPAVALMGRTLSVEQEALPI